MLESIAFIATVISAVICVLMFCVLLIGEMAIAFGAHVPGHRKLGRVWLWVVVFTALITASLITIKSLGL